FLENNSLAPQADKRKIAGPLKPQCVINIGPLAFRLLFFTLTFTIGAEIPIRSFRRSSLILNVNNEGTGGTILCPNSLHISHILVLLPAANIKYLASYLSLFVAICQRLFSLLIF